MEPGWFTTLKSSALSLILHLVIGALLILSFDLTPQPKNQTMNDVNIVEAVAVDKKQVELELKRIKKIEEEKLKKEKKRLDDLEKKTKAMEKNRKQEEKKLTLARKKKEQEQKKRKEEQARITKLEKEKAELKKERVLEEKKIKEAEEKQRKEKEAKEAADRKRLEDELAAALVAEEVAEEKQKDQILTNRIINNIKRSIGNNFNKVGLPEGLQCVLRVHVIPGGEVIDVSIAKSSGHDIFDRRAVNATKKASPLPVPDDIATFERLGLRENNITFKPKN